jgi:hypothetical protein
MRSNEFLTDAFSFGDWPETGTARMEELFSTAKKIKQIATDRFMWVGDNGWYFISKNDTLVGGIKFANKLIAGNAYKHVDVIYIMPEYRKTSAAYWLIYAIKEIIALPIIADGAIFTDGQDLIAALIKHKASRVSAINTKTGEVSPLNGPINDTTLAYLFEANNLGFGKNYFTESDSDQHSDWKWYDTALFPLF